MHTRRRTPSPLRLAAPCQGPAHSYATLRTFGQPGEPRITLYRDHAAWCEYSCLINSKLPACWGRWRCRRALATAPPAHPPAAGPYCHKIVLQLEEKRIPYRIEKINMRCYGDKPPEFMKKVPRVGCCVEHPAAAALLWSARLLLSCC